ncbi:uncharacterized protein LOC144101939 [Amblyomma americanum]
MDNVERLGDEHSAPVAFPERKDCAVIADQPRSLDAAAAIYSGDCNEDCSPSIKQAVTSPLLDLFKDDGSGRHLAINVNNVPSETQAPCVVEHTFVETCTVPANGDLKNGSWKKRMSGELQARGGVSTVEESEPKGASQLSTLAAPVQSMGFHADETPDIFKPNPSSSGTALRSSSPFKDDVFNITHSSSDLLAAVNEDAAESPVTGNAVGKVPPLSSVTPAVGEKLTKGGAPACRSRNCRQLTVDEMACLSDKLLVLDSLTQPPVEKNFPAEENKGNKAKQNPGAVCPKFSLRGLQPEELRRQRDEAYNRVDSLEELITVLKVFYDSDFKFMLSNLRKLEEENRRLSGANEETRLLMQELLSMRGDSSLPDPVCDQLELYMETTPLLRSVAPASGDNLTEAGAPAGSSRDCHELPMGEMACRSDKLLPVDSRTQAPFVENLEAVHNYGKKGKKKPSPVCRKFSLLGLQPEELRRQKDQLLLRQRDEAYDRVDRLENEITFLKEFSDRDSKFMLNKVRKLEEENRRLSGANEEQKLLMLELLSRRGGSSLPDAGCDQVELQVATKPPLRCVTPAAGDNLTEAGAPAGSSRNCRQLPMGEMACPSDKLLSADSRTQPPFVENLDAVHNIGKKGKQKPGPVCPKLSLRGLQPEELRRQKDQLLRRQRDEAYDRVDRLEKEVTFMQEYNDRELEFMLNKVRKLEEENHRLSGANAEQRLLMQVLLSRRGDCSLPDDVCDLVELQVETKPPLRCVTPANGDNLSEAGAPAGSSSNCLQQSMGEMACPSDKLLPVDSRTQPPIEKNLHAVQNNGKKGKQEPGAVCPKSLLRGLQPEELRRQNDHLLRRQRDEAYDRADSLEKEIISLQDISDRDFEFMLNKVRKLEEENRRLSGANAEQRLLMQELLSRRGDSSLSDAVCDELER